MTILSAILLRARAQSMIVAANDMLSAANEIEQIAAPHQACQTSQLAKRHHGYPQLSNGQDHLFLDAAQRAYAERRKRDKFFNSELFGEPAWDIMLDLFIHAKLGKPVQVTSACIGSAVPLTTALRWLVVLENNGYIFRERDPRDARRMFLSLSADGLERMFNFFLAD